MTGRLDAAAGAIVAAREAGAKVGPLDEAIRPRDLAEGYQVQSRVERRLAERFGAPAGYKIAATARAMQNYLGVHAPCHAGLLSGLIRRDGARLRAGDFVRLGIECEIGMRLAAPLDGADVDAEAALGAVGEVFVAAEIVDDRYTGWDDVPTLVADGFFASGGAVTGPPLPLAAVGDLAALNGRILVDGVEVGAGTGRDVLGHPGKALAWLARALPETGRSLAAGDMVLTGSLFAPYWVTVGDAIAVEIDGLGRLDIAIDA